VTGSIPKVLVNIGARNKVQMREKSYVHLELFFLGILKKKNIHHSFKCLGEKKGREKKLFTLEKVKKKHFKIWREFSILVQ